MGVIKKKTKIKKTKKPSSNNFESNKNFFVKNKDLMKRIGFTIILLIIIRLGSFLTVPGIEVDPSIHNVTSQSQFFQLLSTLGGGTIGQFSILALGVSPYITASIIVQLLSTDVIPVLSHWTKSGERGRKKLDKVTKLLMIPFALMQGTATILTLSQQGAIHPKWGGDNAVAFYYILVPLVMLAGSYLMLWFADQITIKGVGNGISIIIFTGIIAAMPSNFISVFQLWVQPEVGESANILFAGILKFLIYVAVFFIVILFVVWMNEAERKIPIQQTGSGLIDAEEHTPYLPLKLNNAGVIPVIFASAIISTPVTIAQILNPTGGVTDNGFVNFVDQFLRFGTWWGICIYAVLIILFTFLYAIIQINSEKIAENFQKSGTFIPGIKPGKDTEKYLMGVINRLSVLGSISLAFIAILPYVIAKVTDLPSHLAIGGTGLIICISVALQTAQQVKGRLVQQNYIEGKKQKFTDDINLQSHIW